MNATRHHATSPQDDTDRCWRNDSDGLCKRQGTGPAGLCAPHRNEMRTWNTTPAPVAAPLDDRPAAATWLDKLDHQLDTAIRNAA